MIFKNVKIFVQMRTKIGPELFTLAPNFSEFGATEAPIFLKLISITASSDGIKRGPRGHLPPSFEVGPELLKDGGHFGPHLLRMTHL